MDSALLVLALPFASFLVLALARPVRRRGRLAGAVGILAMAAAFVQALLIWRDGVEGSLSVPWLPGDGGPMATVGLLVDGLSAPMLVLVTLVSLLVQVYSLAYLDDEPPASLGRYYVYQSLFAFSMLGLVLAPSYIQMFVFWELVGLCSYLLIGFWYTRPAVFVLLAITAFLTAFYMFRVIFIAFFGHAHPHGDGHHPPHDPPWLMRAPLWILALLTIGIGVRFALGAPEGEPHPPAWLTALSLALAAGGIVLAWAMYGAKVIPVELVRRPLATIDFLARRRYFLDAIYGGIYRGIMLGFSRVIGWLDRYFVDGILNVASAWTLRAGDGLRRIQTGQAQDYVYGVAFGVLLLIVWAQWWRSP